ncbi:MAG TPA: beta-propeller fold lactonase family protein [Gaiellaceae bacterium]|nr:beta-propeller fold lactonase family protein [Gaiellaceae bacterium]
MDRIYVQTNDAERNEVVAFDRGADGNLTPIGRFETGGRGSGTPHLASQSSVVVDGDSVLVTNAGSDELSLFRATADGLELAGRVPSAGSHPTSVAVHGELAYVLNNGSPGIAGFSVDSLEPIEGSQRMLAADADPAQIAFSPDGRMLIVTERGTNSISTFAVGDDGKAEGPQTIASSGATPYGFDFAGGSLVVTEAFGGEVGKAAASSYSLSGGRLAPVSASVADTRSEVCWAAVTRDGRFVYVTNFGDGTISSYRVDPDGSLELLEAVAASTNLGEKGVRDEAITGDGRFLYALDADARRIYGWSVGEDGSLAPIGDADGLPETVAGLAAS